MTSEVRVTLVSVPGTTALTLCSFSCQLGLEDGDHVGYADEESEKRGDGGNPRQPLGILALP